MSEPRPPDDLVESFQASEAAASLRPDCPGDERLWEAARGSLARDDVGAIVAHTATCPACSAEWRLAAAIAEEAGATVEREEPSAGSRLVRSPWLLLAAALVGLGVLVPWLMTDGSGPTLYRDQVGESAIAAPECDGATLGREAFRLSWSAVPGARSYAVEVTAADLRLLHAASGLSETELLVPKEALAGVGPGESVVWRVIARMEVGPPVTSPAFVTRLAAGP